ncbi:MAG: hypothetical protein ACFFAN_18740, partial [Promethearchaeota archaeon]
MKKVQITCPSCSKSGFIEILPDDTKDSLTNLFTVSIAEGKICQHSFFAHIDKNLNVLDYFIVDFKLELPETTPEQKIKSGKIPNKDIVDIDLIKRILPSTLLTYILKSIFFKQKIVLIYDHKFLSNQIYNFFKYITQNSFESNITILTKEKYNKNKKNYKDSMVFEDVNILRNVKTLINPKKLYVEKQIVNKFMTEYDLRYSYLLLKNEIQKAYELSKSIVDFINDCKERNETVNMIKISKQLEKKYTIKIIPIYLKFLIEIVENYFQ